MADISSIKLPNNTTLNIKDSTAVASLSFSGHTITATSRGGGTSTTDIGSFDALSAGTVTLGADPTANLQAATKQYVDTQLSAGIAASDAMVFRGTVGTGGTKTSLPTSSVIIGDTYKAISEISIAAGSSWTGSAVSAKSGDLIVAMATTPKWIVVPSGDETVTTLKYSTTTQSLTTSAQSGAITVGEAATKQVVTSIDTSTSLPTSSAVKTFVEGKGYVTSSGVTSISPGVGLTLASGTSITSTGTIKAKLKSETAATYDSETITNTQYRQYAVVADNSGYLSVNVPWGYTFASGTNGFTVTPSGGTAQTITVTPSITNNVTGSGTSGYLAKFTGANTIGNGPQIGTSTTTYLRNDGTWATPPDTTYTAATAAPGNVASVSAVGTSTNYARQDHTHGITLATGDSNGQVKIAGTNVSVKGLGSNAYTSTSYLPLTGGTLTGPLTGTSISAESVSTTSYIAANSGNSGTTGGIALYSTNVTSYGIAMRNTSNGGTHGYVTGDWAIYSYMLGSNASDVAGSNIRGWILRNGSTATGVASVSGAGNAVFNGSVTVGGNAANTRGVELVYNATTATLDFVFK